MCAVDIRSIKMDLRLKYRDIRKKINPFRKNYIDFEILNNFIMLNDYKKSKIIYSYVSKQIEVDTLAIISQAFKDGKKVAVPKCITDKRLMDLYLINSFDDLEIGAFGVLEPIVSKCEKVYEFSKGVCIVPGFCFDREGYRLGYGKGYYDRFLSKFKGKSVGLCYSNCMVKNLPHGYFDKPVDYLITERYIMKISKDKTYNIF